MAAPGPRSAGNVQANSKLQEQFLLGYLIIGGIKPARPLREGHLRAGHGRRTDKPLATPSFAGQVVVGRLLTLQQPEPRIRGAAFPESLFRDA